jgi:hypothetical protein
MKKLVVVSVTATIELDSGDAPFDNAVNFSKSNVKRLLNAAGYNDVKVFLDVWPLHKVEEDEKPMKPVKGKNVWPLRP